MKRKNLFLSLFCLGMMTMTSITFMSCGDDKEEEYKPVLLGMYRTPYIHEDGVYVTAIGPTGHMATCKHFSSYDFTEDGKVTFYTHHYKSCVEEHKYDITDNREWYPILDSNGNTLDWYIEGRGSSLSYSINYEQNKVILSDGKQFFLKSTGKAIYESLLDDKGVAQFVLGSIDDEKYNNVEWLMWLIEAYKPHSNE